MHFSIDFTGPTDEHNFSNLKSFIENQNQKSKIKRILLNIYSLGGSVSGAVAIYNYLKALPFEIQTHNCGEVTSGAILIYLAGVKRTSENYSKFTIHPVALSLNGSYSHFQLKEFTDTLNADIKLYASIVNKETNNLCGDYDVEDLLKGKSVTLFPDEARHCGIITY